MPVKITSLTNTKIKDLVRRRREPDRGRNEVVIDGCREIRLAVDSGVRVKSVFYCADYLEDRQLLASLEKLGPDIFETSAGVFEKISFGDRREGLVVAGEARACSLEDLTLKDPACVLIIENVEKPGNLGAMLRTCDGVGAAAVLLCDQRTYIYNPNVVRSSLGAVFSLPVIPCEAGDALRFLKDRGFRIGAAVPGAREVYHQCDFSARAAVVLGREDSGVSAFWKEAADFQFQIPMRGRVDSLNVSCAAAVVLYEIARQFHRK
jgi:TrmH family RNA methyltransferase